METKIILVKEIVEASELTGYKVALFIFIVLFIILVILLLAVFYKYVYLPQKANHVTSVANSDVIGNRTADLDDLPQENGIQLHNMQNLNYDHNANEQPRSTFNFHL